MCEWEGGGVLGGLINIGRSHAHNHPPFSPASRHDNNRVFSTPVAWPVVTMETVGQTNPVRRDGMVWALSAHYIMLIRPQQALPLVRIY